MHYPLPRRVRRAIAEMHNPKIAYAIRWGQITQTTYPGECMFSILGGPDWPLPEKGSDGYPQVSIAMTCGGLQIRGREEIAAEIERIEGSWWEGCYDHPNADSHLEALRAIQEILEVAAKEIAATAA